MPLVECKEIGNKGGLDVKENAEDFSGGFE